MSDQYQCGRKYPFSWRKPGTKRRQLENFENNHEKF